MRHRAAAELMAKLYVDEQAARWALLTAGMRPQTLPAFQNPASFWVAAFEQAEQEGKLDVVLAALIAAAADTYSGNPEIQAMRAEWGAEAGAPVEDGPFRTLTLIGADLPGEFEATVREALGSADVQLLYVTHQQSSVLIPDAGEDLTRLQRIQETMQTYAPETKVQVVAEEHEFRPYLLSSLFVSGPDLSAYLLQSVPATVTPVDIAAAIVAETRGWSDRPGVPVRTVVDTETAAGFARLDPEKTLHDNNVKDDARLRVGIETLAGGGSSVGPRGPKRILVVATEWSSAHGGLSTLNRRLCLALAAAGAEVYCLVLSPSEQDRREAEAGGVQLINAPRLFGSSEQVALSRRPRLPDAAVPDLIIGHGRITGRPAAVIAHDHFASVPRLHIIHMAPDETEWLKLDRQDDIGLTAEQRMKEERALLCPPAISAGIGPRLHDLVQAELAAFPPAAEAVRIDPGFDAGSAVPRTPPRGRPVRVLIVGRMEDQILKGLDVAARGIAAAIDLLGYDASRVELVVRGVPVGESSSVRDAVHRWSGKRSLRVTPRSYTVDSEELEQDLLRATLVLMPSRAEGFGLVGVEAIVAGTPVLVSQLSGLGELLRDVLPADEAGRLVIPVEDDERDAGRWGAAIAAVLGDPSSAFANAERVRKVMGEERTWAMAAAAVLQVIKD
jgi:glycosyltransferase involved in cell wall biosynthesis